MMIVKESPASGRVARPTTGLHGSARLGEVGLLGDLPLPRTPFTRCMACASPIVIRYHKGVWCSKHAMVGAGLLPAYEWRYQWNNGE